MKILAPTRSLKMARDQIKAGADELYLGLAYPEMVNLNFSGRGRGGNVETIDELKDIICYSHDKGVGVLFCANTPHLTDSLVPHFIRHTERAVEVGVDALIVGSTASLALMSEQNFGLPLVGSVFVGNINRETIRMNKEFGMTRMVAEFKATLDEIRLASEMIPVEVFGNYSCSNHGLCGLFHNAGEEVNLGIPCKSSYSIRARNNGGWADMGKRTAMDASGDCVLCSLPELNGIVHSIKIVDRTLPSYIVATFVRIYKKGIEMAMAGASAKEIMRRTFLRLPMWKGLCISQRCRFLDTPITRAYIGVR